jgi:hypothetical protein
MPVKTERIAAGKTAGREKSMACEAANVGSQIGLGRTHDGEFARKFRGLLQELACGDAEIEPMSADISRPRLRSEFRR